MTKRNSPIASQINTIFVHVSDLKRSVKWYADLLGKNYDVSMVSKPVYNIEITHHTGLTLDAGPEGEMKKPNPSDHPLFNFHTSDIDESYEYVTQLGCNVDSEIVRFEDFSFFTLRDPDHNVIMICTG
ncbi:VOC family protein [Virgibacillus flavescens]|uniref:VOC family protein n=1 Tax=Virgibacillus flavescens TaxID=1611422 RepID=UPI003D32E26E